MCCTRELSQLKMSSVENAMSFWLYHALDFSVHGTTGLAVLAMRFWEYRASTQGKNGFGGSVASDQFMMTETAA